MTAFQNPEHAVDAVRARELIDERAAQVIDVREDHEHEAGHIPGDRHLPMEHVALQTETLDPERPLLFYCRAGIRSGLVTEAYRANGWEAYNLDGGILAWADADQPLEPADGTVAEH